MQIVINKWDEPPCQSPSAPSSDLCVNVYLMSTCMCTCTCACIRVNMTEYVCPCGAFVCVNGQPAVSAVRAVLAQLGASFAFVCVRAHAWRVCVRVARRWSVRVWHNAFACDTTRPCVVQRVRVWERGASSACGNGQLAASVLVRASVV